MTKLEKFDKKYEEVLVAYVNEPEYTGDEYKDNEIVNAYYNYTPIFSELSYLINWDIEDPKYTKRIDKFISGKYFTKGELISIAADYFKFLSAGIRKIVELENEQEKEII